MTTPLVVQPQACRHHTVVRKHLWQYARGGGGGVGVCARGGQAATSIRRSRVLLPIFSVAKTNTTRLPVQTGARKHTGQKE